MAAGCVVRPTFAKTCLFSWAALDTLLELLHYSTVQYILYMLIRLTAIFNAFYLLSLSSTPPHHRRSHLGGIKRMAREKRSSSETISLYTVSIRKNYRTNYWSVLLLTGTVFYRVHRTLQSPQGTFSNKLFGVKYSVNSDDRKGVIRDLYCAALPFCIHSCGTVERARGPLLKPNKK